MWLDLKKRFFSSSKFCPGGNISHLWGRSEPLPGRGEQVKNWLDKKRRVEKSNFVTFSHFCDKRGKN